MQNAKYKMVRRVKGFTLVDVLIAVSLTSFLVILLMVFIGETIKYSTFISRHQQIRSESFAMVNNTLAALIREAVSINYTATDEDTLVLYMSKLEDSSSEVMINLVSDSAADTGQLQLTWGEQTMMLNSSRTVVEDFVVRVPDNPKNLSGAALQAARARQPLVEVTVRSRHQFAAEGMDSNDLTFFQDPRVSYSATYALRNYSFSSLRSS